MSPERDLVLAARFVTALYEATAGWPARFRSIVECAQRAGITGQDDIATAWSTAERRGLLVAHVSEPTVMLTEEGRKAAHPRGAGRR